VWFNRKRKLTRQQKKPSQRIEMAFKAVKRIDYSATTSKLIVADTSLYKRTFAV
jgi:hypothetical protein